MSSLSVLILLASSAVAAVAQLSNAEPTNVTKLNTPTDIIHAPCHTGDTDIHARQLAAPSPSPIWSEPTWVLFNTPTAPPAPPASAASPNHKGDNLDNIVSISVISIVGGGLLLFGILGCVIKAYVQRSSSKAKSTSKSKSKGKATSRRRCNADVEMTAGLTANAAPPAEGYYAPKPRRFEEMDEVVLTPKFPEPVYKNDFPPQPCHYLQGEGRK